MKFPSYVRVPQQCWNHVVAEVRPTALVIEAIASSCLPSSRVCRREVKSSRAAAPISATPIACVRVPCNGLLSTLSTAYDRRTLLLCVLSYGSLMTQM